MVLPLLVGEGGAKQRVRVAHSQWMTCFQAYNFGIRLCVLLTKSLGTLYDFLMRLRIESTGRDGGHPILLRTRPWFQTSTPAVPSALSPLDKGIFRERDNRVLTNRNTT